MPEVVIPEDLAIWVAQTCDAINQLTPDIKGKAFDPDWFMLRQRFEAIAQRVATAESALSAMTADRNLWSDDHGDNCPYKTEVATLREQVARLRAPRITGESAQAFYEFDAARATSSRKEDANAGTE